MAVLPPGHSQRAEIQRALALGLTARNTEMTTRGVMTKDHAVEALLLVHRAAVRDPAFMAQTKSTEALRALALLASAEAQRGKVPLSPGAWGQLLEHLAGVAQP